MTTLTITAVTATAASGTLTSNNTNVSDGDTVTIGTTVYTFKTTLTPTLGQVKIGADADASLLNLIRAVNGTGVNWTTATGATGTNTATHYVSDPHASVRAAGSVTAVGATQRTVVFTALAPGTAGNSIPSTEAAATLSWGGSVLASGSDTVTITGTMSAVTYSQPAQMTTVAEYQSTNRNWSRYMTLMTHGLAANRNGASGVMLAMAGLGVLARSLDRSLTWQPVITTQPVQLNAIATADSVKVAFTVVATSEPTPTYRWQYFPTGGTSWLAATGTINGCTYSNDTTASLSVDASTTGQTSLNHRCVVSNGAGATESAVALLTIT